MRHVNECLAGIASTCGQFDDQGTLVDMGTCAESSTDNSIPKNVFKCTANAGFDCPAFGGPCTDTKECDDNPAIVLVPPAAMTHIRAQIQQVTDALVKMGSVATYATPLMHVLPPLTLQTMAPKANFTVGMGLSVATLGLAAVCVPMVLLELTATSALQDTALMEAHVLNAQTHSPTIKSPTMHLVSHRSALSTKVLLSMAPNLTQH